MMTWRDATRRLTLRLAPGSRLLARTPLRFEVRVAGSTSMREVEFVGKTIEVAL